MNLEDNEVFRSVPWAIKQVISFVVNDYEEEEYDFYFEKLNDNKDSFAVKAVFLINSTLIFIDATNNSMDVNKIKLDQIQKIHRKFDITDIKIGSGIDIKFKEVILDLVNDKKVTLGYPTYGSSYNKRAFERLSVKLNRL